MPCPRFVGHAGLCVTRAFCRLEISPEGVVATQGSLLGLHNLQLPSSTRFPKNAIIHKIPQKCYTSLSFP